MISAVLRSGTPDLEKKSCYDCSHCKASVSWWCTSDDAAEYRGTKIPGIINCKFWEPCLVKSDLSRAQRLIGRYVYIGDEA